MSKTIYFTTPIYYVNSHPHIGHAYTTVVVDVFRRYHALFGEDTFFLTGTDEHGQKIAESAAEKGIDPQVFVDNVAKEFKELWPELHIEYDHFIRTTDPHHKKFVQQVLQNIYDKGEIYLKEYEGLYCVGCERFLDEDELVDGKCPIHLTEPQNHKEQNYFFKMSKYQDWLINKIEENPDLIYPAKYKNEVLQFLKKPLKDLCISRPKSRLTWGIELPFDSNFVTYVWFDALLNYISALDATSSEHQEKYWSYAHHFIGKDILKTHAIYWPCMLHAGGFPIFNRLVVHGHWVIGGTKMSKSLGNVVNPLEMKEKVGTDGLRYFLLRDMSFGEDANFTEELVLSRYHGDLSNNIGNLINRSASLSRKNFDNQVPPCGTLEQEEKELHEEFEKGLKKIYEHVEQFHIHRAIEQITFMSSHVNKYLDVNAPWKLAKDADKKERLGTVLYTALDAARIITSLLVPVMPEKALSALKALGFDKEQITIEDLKLGLLKSGQILPKPDPLFPRIEEKKSGKENKNKNQDKQKSTETQDAISSGINIEDFTKVELKVGKILECQKVPKSDKLLHSQVDLGEEKPRSIVSGVAKFYSPEDITGKSVLVVSNLKPVKLRGVLSQGMILFTDDKKELKLVETPDVAPGTNVR